jgi:branched-subunit amino acid ABC-type transport system permease component
VFVLHKPYHNSFRPWRSIVRDYLQRALCAALLACMRTSLLVVLLLRALYGAQASRSWLRSASLQSHSSTHPSQVGKAYSKILINNKTVLCSRSLSSALRFVFLRQILGARAIAAAASLSAESAAAQGIRMQTPRSDPIKAAIKLN